MKLILLATLLFSLTAYSNTTGVKIESIEPGSPFAQWTLRKGDVIKKINHKEVASVNDLMTQMGNGTAVKSITVLRDGKEVEVKPSK